MCKKIELIDNDMTATNKEILEAQVNYIWENHKDIIDKAVEDVVMYGHATILNPLNYHKIEGESDDKKRENPVSDQKR